MIYDDEELWQMEIEIRKNRMPVPEIYSFLYFLYDGDELAYVGQTRHGVMSRIMSHKKDKVFDSISYIKRVPEEDLSDLEATFIMRYRPKYNTSLPPNNRFMSIDKVGKAVKASSNKVRKYASDNGISPAFGKYLFDRLDFSRIHGGQ